MVPIYLEIGQKRVIAGALTPAGAFGADFVLDIEGVRRFDALP